MNKNSQLGSVNSSDLIDAKLEEHQLSNQCPGCGHRIEGKPVRMMIAYNILGFN